MRNVSYSVLSWIGSRVCRGLEERKLKAQLDLANNKMMLCYRLNKIYVVQHQKGDETSKIDETLNLLELLTDTISCGKPLCIGLNLLWIIIGILYFFFLKQNQDYLSRVK